MKVGIIGAGKLGTAIARRATASHEVVVSGRPGALQTALTLEVMAPGATPLALEDWPEVDVAILAVPLSVALRLDLPLPEGTVVVDATNLWRPVDGDLPEIAGSSSSEAIAARHPRLRWVKSLNHLGYHDYEIDYSALASPPAIGIASDDPVARATTARLISSLGFVPVFIGRLDRGVLLQAGEPVFGAQLSAEQLREATGLRAGARRWGTAVGV